MERYAGSLLSAVKSRLRPYSALALRLMRVAQVDYIKNIYGLHDQLNGKEPQQEITTKEIVFDKCMYITPSV